MSQYKLVDKDLENIDLIISTVPLEVSDVALLRVSPIMTEEEIKVIENQIQYFYNKKFSCAELAVKVDSGKGLVDLLTADVIELDFSATTWEDAVRESGDLLFRVGAVKEIYIQRMIDCVRKMNVYIVICPGLAMPHARYEDGVNRVAVSFLRLKTPVQFGGNDDPRPVDLLFAFSTTDEKSHLRMLQDLWKIFNDETPLNKLRTAESKEAVLEFISDYLKGDG